VPGWAIGDVWDFLGSTSFERCDSAEFLGFSNVEQAPGRLVTQRRERSLGPALIPGRADND